MRFRPSCELWVSLCDFSLLKNRESEGSTSDTDDVVVETQDDRLEGLGGSSASADQGARIGEGAGGDCRDDRIGRRREGQCHVGELSVVGRTEGARREQVEGVGIHMVARLERYGHRGVPRLDEREIIGAHVGQTRGVLVEQGSRGYRVAAEGRRELHTEGGRHRGSGSVVRPFARVGSVLHTEEKCLDGVSEVNVEEVVSRAGGLGVVGLSRGRLDLLDENVARGLTHLHSLLVGDERVLSPHVGDELRLTANGKSGARPRGRHSGLVVVNNKKLEPRAEHEGQLHLVVRESSGREGQTGLTEVSERQGKIEHGGRKGVRGAHNERVGELFEVSYHVLVTVALAGRDGEGRPEVEEVAVHAGLDEVIEADTDFLAKVVHKVPGPADAEALGLPASYRRLSSSPVNGDGRYLDAEPAAEKEVTRSRYGHRELAAELRVARAGQDDGYDGEPRGLANGLDEVSGSVGATVSVLLCLVEGREIDEAGGETTS